MIILTPQCTTAFRHPLIIITLIKHSTRAVGMRARQSVICNLHPVHHLPSQSPLGGPVLPAPVRQINIGRLISGQA